MKAGRLLQDICENFKHFTCLCHALHNLCETIRDDCINANEFVGYIKRKLIKNQVNMELYLSLGNSGFPKFPIMTRWGIWIKFCNYLFENFSQIQTFLTELSKYDPSAISILKLMESKILEEELRMIHAQQFILEAITNLEAKGLSVEDLIKIIKNVRLRISGFQKYEHRITAILNKNPSFEYFLNFNFMRATNEEKTLSHIPLSSVDVERSFSKYREIYSEQRRSLKFETIEKLLFLYYNN